MATKAARHAWRPVVGLLGILLLLAPFTLGANSANPATPSIQIVVRAAIADAMDAGTYKDPAWKSGALDTAVVAQMHNTLHARLSQHMTGQALAAWRSALDVAIDRDSDGMHVIVTAGGVDNIEYGETKVVGDTATVTGRAHTWASWVIHAQGVPGPQSGRPAGWDRFTAALVQLNGTWYVESLSLDPEGI